MCLEVSLNFKFRYFPGVGGGLGKLTLKLNSAKSEAKASSLAWLSLAWLSLAKTEFIRMKKL